MSTSLSCASVREQLLIGDSPLSDSLLQHLEQCQGCRREASSLDLFRGAVQLSSARRLDDLAQQRIQGRLNAAIDRLEAKRQSSTAPGWRWLVAASLVALMVGAVLGREYWGRAPAPASLERLAPFSAAGLDQAAAERLRLGVGRSSLEVGAGVQLRAWILGSRGTSGGRDRITLVGPAQLALRAAPEERTELELRRGLLLAEVDHLEGRSFKVYAPGLTVTVVGTLFSVDLRDPARPEVGVLRGAVTIRRGEALVSLSPGQWWRAGEPLRPLPASTAALLAEHAAALPARAERQGVLFLDGSPAGAQVKLAGRRLGSTPLALLMPAGMAGLTLAAPDHAPTAVRVAVQPGQTTRFGFALSRQPRVRVAASLPVSHPPEAKPGDRATRGPGSTARRGPAEALYRQAEAALREGDPVTARDLLGQLVSRFPGDPAAAMARYELARLARRAGAVEEARAHLEELAGGRDARFRDPARFQLCQMLAAARRSEQALACLTKFRADFSGSPHDAEALALQAQLAELAGGCARARAALEEYLRRYPSGRFAEEARQRSQRCAR